MARELLVLIRDPDERCKLLDTRDDLLPLDGLDETTGARSYVAIDTQGDEYVHVFIDPSIARELATDGVLPFDVA